MERKFYSIACLFRVWDSFHYIMQKTKQGGDVVYMSMEMFSVKDTQPCRCIRYYLCIRYFRSKLNTSVCPEILCTIHLIIFILNLLICTINQIQFIYPIYTINNNLSMVRLMK